MVVSLDDLCDRLGIGARVPGPMGTIGGKPRMSSVGMCKAFKDKTGRTAWTSMQHPAGPSICARDSFGAVHGIVIPIDTESRSRAVDALAEICGPFPPVAQVQSDRRA